jgi:hypothetical protein
MKIKDVVFEGIWDDLKAIGRQEQQNIKQSVSQAGSSTAGAVGSALKKIPGVAAIQQKTAEIKKLAQTGAVRTLADTMTKIWEAEAKKLNAAKPPGEVMDLDEYKTRFAAWLETAMRGEVQVDENSREFNNLIRGTDPRAVNNYLANYFIPAYQVSKTQTGVAIPNGTRVKVSGAVAGNVQISDEIYTYTNGRWSDSQQRPVIAGSKLHQALTQDAISKIKSMGTVNATI